MGDGLTKQNCLIFDGNCLKNNLVRYSSTVEHSKLASELNRSKLVHSA